MELRCALKYSVPDGVFSPVCSLLLCPPGGNGNPPLGRTAHPVAKLQVVQLLAHFLRTTLPDAYPGIQDFIPAIVRCVFSAGGGGGGPYGPCCPPLAAVTLHRASRLTSQCVRISLRWMVL